MKSPHILAEERLNLSEEYSRYSGELAKLIKKQAEYYVEHRPEYKSDTAVERAFQNTQDGVTLTIVKLKLKSLEKQMSAIKTMLDTLTEEARGLY